eukprot:Gb_25661 [translate_table: standard]
MVGGHRGRKAARRGNGEGGRKRRTKKGPAKKKTEEEGWQGPPTWTSGRRWRPALEVSGSLDKEVDKAAKRIDAETLRNPYPEFLRQPIQHPAVAKDCTCGRTILATKPSKTIPTRFQTKGPNTYAVHNRSKYHSRYFRAPYRLLSYENWVNLPNHTKKKFIVTTQAVHGGPDSVKILASVCIKTDQFCALPLMQGKLPGIMKNNDVMGHFWGLLAATLLLSSFHRSDALHPNDNQPLSKIALHKASVALHSSAHIEVTPNLLGIKVPTYDLILILNCFSF